MKIFAIKINGDIEIEFHFVLHSNRRNLENAFFASRTMKGGIRGVGNESL